MHFRACILYPCNLFLRLPVGHSFSNPLFGSVLHFTVPHFQWTLSDSFCYVSTSHLVKLRPAYLPGAAKSNPLKLFAVFSATAWNFSVKFYAFI